MKKKNMQLKVNIMLVYVNHSTQKLHRNLLTDLNLERSGWRKLKIRQIIKKLQILFIF